MNDNQIIEAIRNATNNTFIGNDYSSTLMGWTEKYDNKGRLITANPNYKMSSIIIDNIKYKVIRKGWYAWIFKPEYFDKVSYMTFPDKDLLIGNQKIDFRPDYVKEYMEKHDKEL